MFCPIIRLLALAFADNAFKELGIKEPEDLFSLEIPHFRDPTETETLRNAYISLLSERHYCNSTPWTFTDFKYCMKRLGFLLGYPQTLTSYVLHRGQML